MKRMLALLLSVIMICSMITPVYAADGVAVAASATTFTVTPSATEVYRGDEITVVVSASGDNAFTSMGYMADTANAHFTVTGGEVMVSGAMLSEWSNTDGGVALFTSASARSGEMFQFTVKIKDDAPFGAFTLTADDGIALRNGANTVAVDLVEPKLVVLCRHEYSAWENMGDDHQKVCTICGDVQTDDHSMSDWQQGTDAGHEQVCVGCGKTIVEAHTYKKGVCGVCGYVTEYVEFSVQPSATEVYRGDELQFTVTVNGDKALSSIGYIPLLDSEVFEIVSGEILSGTQSAAMKEWNNVEGGVAYFASAGVHTGEMFRFTVRIKDDAPFGAFTATDELAAHHSATVLVPELEETAVTVLCRHELETAESLGEQEHRGTCPTCGEVVTKVHTFVKGQCTVCGEMEDYTVTFYDEDGTVLSTETYHYGDTVTEPATPTKAADNTFTYAFSGWDKDVVTVTGSADYKATYKATYIEYTVTFKDYDDKVISQKTYHYGDKVDVPADPERAADNTYTYAFSGWDKAVAVVSGDAVYTATYQATYIEYTVTFQNWDGTLISEQTYHYGDTVEVPADPEKEGDKTYYYVFTGWDKDVAAVSGNVDYIAQYEQKYVEYTVTFQYEDGTVISQNTYHYGDPVEVPADPAVPEALAQNHVFDGWDKEITAVEADAVYTAKFKMIYKRGDVNQDDAVTDADAMYLLRHTLFGSGRYPLNQSGDMNGDGTVADSDAMYLLRHTLFGSGRYPLH